MRSTASADVAGAARRASDSPAARALARAGGIDKALLTLRNQPFGEFLLILAALGLVTFGVYGLCEARWRKV
jgi:Domain of Unknown Function (DUF1206)